MELEIIMYMNNILQFAVLKPIIYRHSTLELTSSMARKLSSNKPVTSSARRGLCSTYSKHSDFNLSKVDFNDDIRLNMVTGSASGCRARRSLVVAVSHLAWVVWVWVACA